MIAFSIDDLKKPDTDEWWMLRLSKKLAQRLPRMAELQKWFEGNPPLAYPDASKEGFERLQKLARLNLAELIVNAVLYRMTPLAFRTAVEDDDNGDSEASRIWKDNRMKTTAAEILEWMLSLSIAYASVDQKITRDGARALIRSEHPTQCITEDDPENPGYALAALKIYRDDLRNRDVAVLYRRGTDGNMATMRVAVHQGNSILPGVRTNTVAAAWQIRPGSWEWEDEAEELFSETVPIHKFENRNGTGEFEKHIATLERINHTILQRMIIIAFQAFRQRAVKGVPNTDEDGKEIDYSDIFKSDPGAIWLLPEVAEFWESAQADLTPVLTSVKDDIIHLAVSSQTPLFSVVPDAANGSAEGAALQREGLLFKVEDCISRADHAFAATMADAFAAEGDSERADVADIEVVWASPRRSSLTERAVSAVQAMAAGAPWRTVMTLFLELTPDQVALAEKERVDDMYLQALMGASDNKVNSLPGTTDIAKLK
jgi:hypothetical protein